MRLTSQCSLSIACVYIYPNKIHVLFSFVERLANIYILHIYTYILVLCLRISSNRQETSLFHLAAAARTIHHTSFYRDYKIFFSLVISNLLLLCWLKKFFALFFVNRQLIESTFFFTSNFLSFLLLVNAKIYRKNGSDKILIESIIKR